MGINQGTHWSESIEAMTILAWALIFIAVLFQIINFVIALRKPAGRGGSQVLLVPCILWYVALVIRGDAFFLSSEGLELGAVFMVHLILTITAPLIGIVIYRAKRES